jgi:hypothetical protein
VSKGEDGGGGGGFASLAPVEDGSGGFASPPVGNGKVTARRGGTMLLYWAVTIHATIDYGLVDPNGEQRDPFTL